MESAIIISRCSTNETKQDVTRQTIDLTSKYDNRFNITKIFEYYQSGTSNDIENASFLDFAIKNNIDHILVTELSRISRTVIGFLQFKHICDHSKINIIINDKNLNTLCPDKSIDLNTELVLTIGASFAKMELTQTKSRLESGYKKYRAAGGIVGRKVGYKKSDNEMVIEHSDIVKRLKSGKSIRYTATDTAKSIGTVQRVKKIIDNTK
jgi:DNA invertase Pin-like site-specific DNA recombinase